MFFSPAVPKPYRNVKTEVRTKLSCLCVTPINAKYFADCKVCLSLHMFLSQCVSHFTGFLCAFSSFSMFVSHMETAVCADVCLKGMWICWH